MKPWTPEAYILMGSLGRQIVMDTQMCQVMSDSVWGGGWQKAATLMLDNKGQKRVNKVSLTPTQLTGLSPLSLLKLDLPLRQSSSRAFLLHFGRRRFYAISIQCRGKNRYKIPN